MRTLPSPTARFGRAVLEPRVHKIAAAVLVAVAAAGCKAHIPASSQITGTVQTSQPAAYSDLCRRHANLCDVPDRSAERPEIALDQETFDQLDSVNMSVNRAVRYRSDQEVFGRSEYWTVVEDGEAGDCEDFALTKMRRLLDRGFPREAMRLAIVHRPRDGIRHAVLTVDTDRGTYVLDSSHNRVMAWSDLPYTNWIRERPGRERWSLTIDRGNQTAALR